MNLIEVLKNNIKKNTGLWTALWILLMLNTITVVALSRRFSVGLLLLVILVAGVGILVIQNMAKEEAPKEGDLPPELQAELDAMMEEMKPHCDNIFSEKIDEFTRPLIENLNKDFSRGLQWLWEDGDDFLLQVTECIGHSAAALNLIDPLSEEKTKMIKQMRDKLVLLNNVVTSIEKNKEASFQDMYDFLQNKVDELKESMDSEKDIFYDYIGKLLLQQIKLHQEEAIEDLSEYFNVYKLGEQFSVILEKSLEARLITLHDSIIRELENFSADVVGGMQKNISKLRNTMHEVEEMLSRLINDYRGTNSLLTRRLQEAIEAVRDVEEKSGDILVTLAWQDILVEKRWGDITDMLNALRDKVMENVDREVVAYIGNGMDAEIQGFSALTRVPENMTLYKSVVGAELIYQLYTGGKLTDIIGDGVYALLQFVLPVEILTGKSLRLSEEGLKSRRSIRVKIKSGEYQQLFERVKEVTVAENHAVTSYLDDVFPKSFSAFCNNPYIKQKPDNLNQAAWSIFMELIEEPSNSNELYALVGHLLVIHSLRNKYLHPLKNTPTELQAEEDLVVMRQAALKAIKLLLQVNIVGVVKLSYRFR